MKLRGFALGACLAAVLTVAACKPSEQYPSQGSEEIPAPQHQAPDAQRNPQEVPGQGSLR